MQGPVVEYIKDSGVDAFMEDVINDSRTRPVLVDFWADWCEPCKQLTPVLEEVVMEAGGAVALVKVNADQNKTLMAQLQVQSLPTVIIFFQGQPVNAFQGAVPKSQLKAMVSQLIEATGGAASEAGDPIQGALEEVKALQEADRHEEARALLARLVEVAPETIAAQLYLLDYALQDGDTASVEEGLNALDPEALEDDALKALYNRLKTALSLAGEGDAGADIAALEARIEADSMDHTARFELALTHQARGDLPKAAEALLGSIMRDKEWEDGKARTQLLKLFEAAGQNDPFTLKYRRRLSSMLFS